MAGKVVVPHPVTGDEFSCCESVAWVPCPQCRAPVGVPCRGARWRAVLERSPGWGRTRWWWSDSHFVRRLLCQRVRRGDRRACLNLNDAMQDATMSTVDHRGHPVDVSEEEFPEPR